MGAAQYLTGAQRQAQEAELALERVEAAQCQNEAIVKPLPVKDSDAYQLADFKNLASEDVSLAIASLTVGIHQAGGPVLGVATDALQQLARQVGSNPVTTPPQTWTIYIANLDGNMGIQCW